MKALDALSPMDPTPMCSARSSRTGQPCKKRAVRGAAVCASHGGRAPQVRAAAGRRLALGEAIAELSKLGRPIEVDPAEAMLEMVYEAAGNVAALRRLVQQLQVNTIDPGTGVLEGGGGDPPFMDDIDRSELGAAIASRVDPANWKAAPHIWVAMYDAERERLVKWAKACRDAGVDERRVRLAEDRGAQIAQVLTVAAGMLFELLRAAGVDAALLDGLQREQLPGVFRTAITTTLAGEAG